MSALPALLLFLLLHGIFFHDVAFHGHSLSASTFVAGLTPHGPVDAPPNVPPPHLLDAEGAAWVDEPSPYLARAAFAAGELPLWNPGTGLGAPLAANLNSGAGNPLQLALNLWPSPRHADLFHLARLVVLACGMWVFLRELGVTALAASVGAVILAYGGYPLAWIVHHPLSTELFLPWMLLGLERGRQGRAGGWALLVVAAAGSLLGGKLQASLLCFAFVAIWAWMRGRRRDGGRGWVTAALAIGGLAGACLVAAFLLVPAVELMVRASGLTLGGRAQLAGFMVPWPSLASLAVPGLFVAPGRSFADGLLTPAIGSVAVLLAAIGIAAQGSPFRSMARLCGLWAAVLLLRNAGAFGNLAVHLPAIRGILFVKYTFTIGFALAVAAAIGLDAIVAGRIDARRARRAGLGALAAIGALLVAAIWTAAVPTFPRHVATSAAIAAMVLALLAAWRAGLLGREAVAAAFAVLVVVELRCFAPAAHPPLLDPYRPPAFVEFLRAAPPGRIIADAELAVPLTSAAAGLTDLRAIDVLTPGSYYAFFTRLVSFCDRVIHFTVDPDLAVAASAPALDLAAVRWIVTRSALPTSDLATRVRNQVGRERTARLFAGMHQLRTGGGALAIGPVALGDDARFAFTLPTPFTLDVTADSDAAELAWGTLVRGAGSGILLRTRVDGVPSDAPADAQVIPTGDAWHEQRVTIGRAGEHRRMRLRIEAVSRDGSPANVSLGNLGYGPGAAAEVRLAAERGARHAAEAGALREAFRDPVLGVTVYENRNALPRAFRVRHAEPTASLDAALTRLGDGFDFRTAALVAKADVVAVSRALASSAAQASAPSDETASAAIRGATPGSVTVATDGATPALLVLADLAYPGWRAEVDGADVPVYTVDGVLRGVVVPAGPHEVVFRYRPTSALIGALVTCLAFVALVPYARVGARLHGDGTRA